MRIANMAVALCLWPTILVTPAVDAAPIVSETGLIGPILTGVNGGLGLEVSWSSSILYTNVTIAATIFSGSSAEPGSNSLFLTTRIGPGTTTANEIARSTLTIPPGAPTTVTLFSGLTLPSNNYFLVLGGPSTPAIFWATTDSPVITTDPATEFQSTGVASPNCGLCPYVPAATFDTGLQFHFLFDVSGTPVPEPGAMMTVCLGLLTLVGTTVNRLRAPIGGNCGILRDSALADLYRRGIGGHFGDSQENSQ